MRLQEFLLQGLISIKLPSFPYTQGSSLNVCVLFLHTLDKYFAFASTSSPSISFHIQFLTHCTLGTFLSFHLLLLSHGKLHKSRFFRSRKLFLFLCTYLLKSIGYRNCRYYRSLNPVLLLKIILKHLFRTLCILVCSYCLIRLYTLLQLLLINLYCIHRLD